GRARGGRGCDRRRHARVRPRDRVLRRERHAAAAAHVPVPCARNSGRRGAKPKTGHGSPRGLAVVSTSLESKSQGPAALASAVDVILRDGGTLRLRPPGEADVEGLLSVFDGLFRPRRYPRFPGPPPRRPAPLGPVPPP